MILSLVVVDALRAPGVLGVHSGSVHVSNGLLLEPEHDNQTFTNGGVLMKSILKCYLNSFVKVRELFGYFQYKLDTKTNSGRSNLPKLHISYCVLVLEFQYRNTIQIREEPALGF